MKPLATLVTLATAYAAVPRNDLGRLVRLATAYDRDDDEGGDEVTFTLPENYATLPDDEIVALREQATEVFNSIYDPEAEAGSLSDEDVQAMSALADAVEALDAELSSRAQQGDARRQTAAEMDAGP